MSNDFFKNRVPEFQPRKITQGADLLAPSIPNPEPIPPAASSTQDEVVTLLEEWNKTTQRLDHLGTILDAQGNLMNICRNLPPVIAERYLKHKLPEESCWAFYKRMVALAQQHPEIDWNSTFAEDVANQTHPSDASVTGDFDMIPEVDENGATTPDFNQNPGKIKLLLMLFLAILKWIVSGIIAVAFAPFQWLENKWNSVEILGARLPQIHFVAEFKTKAIKWAEDLISRWTKQYNLNLTQDVERMDATIFVAHIEESVAKSDAQYWPESALLYSKYYALRRNHEQGESVIRKFAADVQNTGVNTLEAVAQTATTAYQMPKDLYDLFTLQKDYTETSIYDMETLLTRQFGDNLFCCIFRLLGSYQVKMLKAAKLLLKLSLNRHAIYITTLGTMLNNVLVTVIRGVLLEIFKTVYAAINIVNNEIKQYLFGRVQSSLDDRISGASKCISYELFIQTLLQFINELENSILDLVLDFRNSLNQQNEYTRLYIGALTQSKYIKRMLRLIDIILEAKSRGELCKTSAVPTDQEILDLWPVIQDDPDFGGLSPTGLPGTTPPGGDTESSHRVIFDDCLQKVPREDLEMVMNWITRLQDNK
jgi:hypothetical protein